MTQPSTAERPRWWQPLALACVLGVGAGLVHSLVVLFRRHVLEEFTWTSRDLLWMSPLGNALMFLAVALPFVLLLAIRPKPLTWRICVGLLAWIATVSALLGIRGLHTWAVLVLGAGIAFQLARMRWTRRLTARLAAGAVAVVALTFLATSIDQRDRNSATGTPTGAPNVLVLILDTVRAASTSLHGYARATTPELVRLAEEGAMFEWAVAPSSWTLPSHGAMFTGRRASSLSTSWRKPLDTTHPTVAEAFRDNGYATGAFVGNPFYTHHESGLARGFNVLRDFRRSRLQLLWSTTIGQTPFVNSVLWNRTPAALLAALRTFDLQVPSEPQSDRRWSPEIIAEFLEWQEKNSSRPFFAFLNLYDAHDPYEPPREVRKKFAESPNNQDLYDAGIAYQDAALRHLFDVMRERGLLDRTLIVVTSDHGEQWGEHDLKNHGNSLYLPAVHVPLVLRYPERIAAGTRVRQMVSLTDLAATLADAAGLKNATLPGESLLGACCATPTRYSSRVVTETEQLDRSTNTKAPAQRGPLASLFRDSLQYIRNGDSTFQLFDVVNDYAQARNLLEGSEGCLLGAALDSMLRQVAPLPKTPAHSADRCTALTAALRSGPSAGQDHR